MMPWACELIAHCFSQAILAKGRAVVRISKQISGNAAEREEESSQGRGEYEWCDIQPGDPTKAELLNKRIMLRFPDDVILDTACELAYQGDKWRLRVAEDARIERFIYPHYHIAVALLMPMPTRKEQKMGTGLPVLRHDEYILTDIIAGRIPLPTGANADIEAVTVRAGNGTVPQGQDFPVAERFAHVRKVWQNRDILPERLRDYIAAHEQLVLGGDQISITGRRLVRRIQIATSEASRELDVTWCTNATDPLPTLLEMLGIAQIDPVPTPVEEIPPEHPEIRRRELARQRRLASARGPGSGRFRKQVRDAYRSSCIICGLRLPKVWSDGRAGVDSAHILPDSEFELNHITNGLCLCKIHHWAFDEGLIEIRHALLSGYSVAIPEEVELRAADVADPVDISFLRTHVGPIPPERLPADRRKWPNPECLQRLRELLYP
jgi:putative restriction endonuclease